MIKMIEQDNEISTFVDAIFSQSQIEWVFTLLIFILVSVLIFYPLHKILQIRNDVKKKK